ncbi:MAG: LamG domain-containing protein [Candidatus Pacearchaeota archaeon]
MNKKKRVAGNSNKTIAGLCIVAFTLILTFILLIGLTIENNNASTEVLESPMDDSLELFLPFNGNVTDISGNNYAGTPLNVNYDVNGKTGLAISTPGNKNGSIAFGDILDMGREDFTISFWIKNFNGEVNHFVLSKGEANNNGKVGYDIRGNGNGGLVMYLQDGEVKKSVAIKNIGNNKKDYWTHITFVVDRSNGVMSSYVDGTLNSSVNIDSITRAIDNNFGFMVGCADWNANHMSCDNPTNTSMALDNLRIYSVALTPTQVKEIQNQTNTVLYYSLNGGTGCGTGITCDRSGNNHHGELNGPSLVTTSSGKGYKFDGVNDYIKINDNNDGDLRDIFTILIKMNVSADDRTEEGSTIYSDTNDIKTGTSLIYYNHTKNVSFYHNNGTAFFKTSIISETYPKNVAAVFRRGNISLYVDGKWSSSTAKGINVLKNPTIRRISKGDLGPNNWFKGIIDEFIIYSSVFPVKSYFSGTTCAPLCPAGYCGSDGCGGICTCASGTCEDEQCVDVTCVDSDDGESPHGYYLAGEVDYKHKGTAYNYEDKCINSTNLFEWSCSGNDGTNATYQCPEGCSANACQGSPVESCDDDETGKSASIFGTVVYALDDEEEEFEDTCINANSVKEWFCDGDSVDSTTLTCASGTKCSSGACRGSANLECETDDDCDSGEECSSSGVCVDASGECTSGEDKCEGVVFFECVNEQWIEIGEDTDECGVPVACETDEDCTDKDNGECKDGACVYPDGGNGWVFVVLIILGILILAIIGFIIYFVIKNQNEQRNKHNPASSATPQFLRPATPRSFS